MAESPLFTPATIGPVKLRNRTIRAAAFEGMCPDHNPSEALLRYHLSVAEGGIGMTTVAYASVSRSGLSFPHQLWLRKEVVPELRRLTKAVHSRGAAASIQIGHCGNMAKSSITGSKPLSPSGKFNLYTPTFTREINQSDITGLVEDFGDAAELARDAGFDAIEVHAGHGYLISQFLSPHTNKRKDIYGGSFENRSRFMIMVIREVMMRVGKDMAVLVKTNMNDGFKGGMISDECLRTAQILEEEGIHALVLSGGFVSKSPMFIMRGAMPIRTLSWYIKDYLMKIGIRLAGRIMIPSVPFSENYFLQDAVGFRKELRLPLIYVGGITSMENIEEVLSSGFEFVAMARSLVNEPNFINRLKSEEGARSKCNHSNYCIARMYTTDMACHQNLSNLPSCLKKELGVQ